MKKFFIVLLLLLPVCGFSQDIIVKKNGLNEVCRIIDINTLEVTFKRWSDLNGANYIVSTTDISKVNFEDGRTWEISDNTATGYDTSWTEKYNRLRRTAWIGGGIFAGQGVLYLLSAIITYDDIYLYIGSGCIAVGAIWTGSFLYAASRTKKSHLTAQACPIWQNELHFNDGTSFSYGVDAICDNYSKNNTFGLGIRYNF